MRVVTSAEIDRVLTFPALIEALAEAFRGDMVTPVRHHHEIERPGANATLLLMPAWTGAATAEGFLGVKIVSVFPENGKRQLPSVLGTYLLMDGATGEPRAALDGTRLTHWRTAAASAPLPDTSPITTPHEEEGSEEPLWSAILVSKRS